MGVNIVVSEQVKINSERIDDIPVIVEWLKKMDIATCIDQKLSPPHGNYQGQDLRKNSLKLLSLCAKAHATRTCPLRPLRFVFS